MAVIAKPKAYSVRVYPTYFRSVLATSAAIDTAVVIDY
ncbi:hypothetical protein MPER_04701 [Moniliophthora perniciosa FA553]|nr:hypothetical protein MPER_04701 [Moniliophthora perniciosa FA553]